VSFRLAVDLKCRSRDVLKAVKPPNIMTRILTVRPSMLNVSKWTFY
jgi:hypothetical protein